MAPAVTQHFQANIMVLLPDNSCASGMFVYIPEVHDPSVPSMIQPPFCKELSSFHSLRAIAALGLLPILGQKFGEIFIASAFVSFYSFSSFFCPPLYFLCYAFYPWQLSPSPAPSPRSLSVSQMRTNSVALIQSIPKLTTLVLLRSLDSLVFPRLNGYPKRLFYPPTSLRRYRYKQNQTVPNEHFRYYVSVQTSGKIISSK